MWAVESKGVLRSLKLIAKDGCIRTKRAFLLEILARRVRLPRHLVEVFK